MGDFTTAYDTDEPDVAAICTNEPGPSEPSLSRCFVLIFLARTDIGAGGRNAGVG